ncbi:MAG: hypothetical protein WBH50_14715, partial [Fuerstiella sp.]
DVPFEDELETLVGNQFFPKHVAFFNCPSNTTFYSNSVGSMSTLGNVLQVPEQRLKVRHLILLFLAVDVFKQVFVQSAQEPVAA